MVFVWWVCLFCQWMVWVRGSDSKDQGQKLFFDSNRSAHCKSSQTDCSQCKGQSQARILSPPQFQSFHWSFWALAPTFLCWDNLGTGSCLFQSAKLWIPHRLRNQTQRVRNNSYACLGSFCASLTKTNRSPSPSSLAPKPYWLRAAHIKGSALSGRRQRKRRSKYYPLHVDRSH